MHWIFAHLAGDFILQNDWMAKGKKESSWHCSVHVAVYMIPFMFTGLAWWQLLLIAAQHWLQDRTDLVEWLMRITRRTEYLQPPLAPWSIIMTDGILHILWIAFVVSIQV